MTSNELENAIEALLFSAEQPLSLNQLKALLGEHADTLQLQHAIENLQTHYNDRGVVLKQLASGYQMQTHPDTTPWVHQQLNREEKYSAAFLETLAIIIYRQPVTRGEIEDIRGVAVNSQIIKQLLERQWIKGVGHKDVPGRPELLGTTKHLLNHFDVKSLNEFPQIDFTAAPLIPNAAVDASTADAESSPEASS